MELGLGLGLVQGLATCAATAGAPWSISASCRPKVAPPSAGVAELSSSAGWLGLGLGLGLGSGRLGSGLGQGYG